MISHDRATGVPSSATSTGRPRLLGQVLEPLLVLAVFAGAGAAVGWIWERWWTPTVGVVVDGTWVPGYRAEGDLFVFDFPSLEGFFDGTAMYVVLGVAAGVLIGAGTVLSAADG